MLVFHKLIFVTRKIFSCFNLLYVGLINVQSFGKHVSSFVTYIPLFFSVYLDKGPAGSGNEFCHILFTCLEHAEFHLNLKNRVSYIWDGRTATLQMLHFIFFFSTNLSTEYFKHVAHSPFFSLKCRSFHNTTFFGSCIIHILHTGCAKI
jgi:hypothetical protein